MATLLHNNLMNILQNIFNDHYEEIIYLLHPRHTEVENINKLINCGNPSYGGAMYGCLHCGNLKFVPFRCHSRFCPTCGYKYSLQRSTNMSFKLVNSVHRHCVFTIDERLRVLFLNDRSLLNCLFDAVRSVISRMFFNLNKSLNFTPGFIMVLHTFGRDLKWNPHIHCLVSEGGLSDSGIWRNVSHFNYSYLRNSFRTALLNMLSHRIGPSFNKLKSLCYRENKYGFYVFAKPNKCNPQTVIDYIGRYLGRPVIATSRIDSYDGDFVSFHYNRHEDKKLVQETLPVLDFIKRLIRHIPEKHFKMIRYGGLYARHRKTDKKLFRSIHPERHRLLRSFTRWRECIILSFGYDPLYCPNCHKTMTVLEIYHKHQVVSLEDMYARVMSSSRLKNSYG